ncbi:MAG: hypothetical protein KIG16_00050 [Eubacteriales bacterium]|nr:hypothetical protein [Eubacteriales bacterium]
MSTRYSTKEDYLQFAAAAEKGVEYKQVVAEKDLRLMNAAKRRLGLNDHFTLGDCKITGVINRGLDLVIDFDNSQGFVNYNQIVFENGNVVEMEYPMEGSFFLNHDLYFENGLFTFYCLIWSPESQESAGLGYLTFTATDIKVNQIEK